MGSGSRVLLIAFAAAASCSLAAASALAQDSSDVAARHNLLDQAQSARDAGDHARALDLARRAGELRMTPSLRMFVAQEERALGQFAPALGDAEECVSEIQRDATAAHRDAILAECRALAQALQSQVGQVTVRVPTPSPSGTRVTVAERPVPEALWGAATVVTPGTVLVQASAPGHAPFRREIRVGAGQTETVDIVLPEVSSTAGPAGPASSSSASTQMSPAGGTSHADSGGFLTPIRAGGIVVGGLGIVALAVGAGLYADTTDKYNQCVATNCPPEQRAVGENWAAVSMLYGGAGFVIAGALMLVFGGPHRAEQAHVSAWISPTGAAGIVGTF